ncbi:MAG: hypothetical protein CL758_05250 [Chloroflexi bacterium]|nr:hypothetical protein [Chloroflexota bacterium]|tara:strand:+ start:9627 stop:10598 length:972 start_codon:yes stop_codon:yes gene_type:complete
MPLLILELDIINHYMNTNQGHLEKSLARLYRKKLAIISILLLILIYLISIFIEWISPYGYDTQDLTMIRSSPSFQHWLGTDNAGRDILTRVFWGVQNSLIITLISIISGSIFIGVTLGLISGYYGKWADALIQRSGEIFASFPDIFLIILLVATIRPRVVNWIVYIEDRTFFEGLLRSGIADYLIISFALVAFSWYGMSRFVRGQVLTLQKSEFIESAKAIGCSNRRILFLHVLPNVMSTIIVTTTMSMGVFVGTEIILGFLGLGVQPPRPSLGVMLSETGNLSVIRNYPWMLIGPGLISSLLLLCWNILGDSLNDVFNPRTK